MSNVSEIRSLFLSHTRPTAFLTWPRSSRSRKRMSSDGSMPGNWKGWTRPRGWWALGGARVVRDGLLVADAVEQALGTDAIDLTRAGAAHRLEVRIPRLQVVTLERLGRSTEDDQRGARARAGGSGVGACTVARRGRAGFAAAFAWPETDMGGAG